jgi:MHS family proline/betaine transporter-like MFS transporter
LTSPSLAATADLASTAPAQTGSRERPGRVSPRLLLAGIIGNTLEWYDFAAYGFLAAVFAKNFFPTSDPFVGLISAFGVFAASFLMRPIGGIVFGHVGDRYGRRFALYISAGMMTVSTVAIGLLPTYAAIGAGAPVLLLALRLLQGLSIGGEYTTSAIFLAESAAPERRGLMTSFAAFGATGGTLLGSAVAALVATLVSQEALVEWGWRVPFLAGIILGGFAFFLRRSGAETRPPHAERRDLPIVDAFRFDLADMVRGVALSAMLGAGFYLIVVYLTTYMQEIDGLTARASLQINTLTMVLLLVVCPLAAALSDRIGRRKVMVTGLVGLILFTWPLFRLIDGGGETGALLGQLGLGLLLGIYCGPVLAALVEMFRPDARCSAVSLSYNLSMGIAGGTAPMVAVYLVSREQFDMGPAAYLILLSAISLAAALTMTERAGTKLR